MKYLLLSSFCVLVTLSMMVDAASAEGTVWRVDCSYAGQSDVPPANTITGNYVEPAAAAANAAFGSAGVSDLWNTWDMDARSGVLGGWAWFNGVLTADADSAHSTLWSTDGGTSVLIGSTANNGQHQPWYDNGSGTPFAILTGSDTSSGINAPGTYSFVISGLIAGRTFLFYDYAHNYASGSYGVALNGGPVTTVTASDYAEGSPASGVLLSTTVQVSGCVTVKLTSANMTGPGFQFAELPPAPEVNVKGNGNSITNGDVTPSGSDNTDFSQIVVGSSVTNTFTIENTGNAPLAVTNVTVGGDFSVVVQPSDTVSGGGSTTFMVSFTPQGLGAQTQTLSIANSDSDEGNYTFWLSGAGVAVPTPEIDITGTNGASIACGAAASVASGTDFGSVDGSHTFTITNAGLASLSLTGTPSVVISGAGAEQFTVTSFPSESVASHGATTFTVQFTAAGAAGVKTATVSIGNNDTSGGEDPYTFSLAGLVPPVIKVWRVDCSYAGQSDVPPVNIITGDYVEPAAASANAAFGASGVHDYWNTWDIDSRSGVLGGWAWYNGVLTADADSANSTLWSTDGGTAVKIGSIANNGQHQPWTGNGSGTPFDILTGSETSSGLNGADPASTYSFVISGLTAGRRFLFYDYAHRVGPRVDILPAYKVSLDGGPVTTNYHTLYSEGDAASGVLLSTVIGGAGTVTITLTAAGFTGPGFQFAELPPAPEINVTGNGSSITNGDSAPSGGDGTDFGQTLSGGSVTNSFTIESVGNLPLAVSNVSVVGSSDFSVAAQPSNSVGAGSSAAFDIVFTPTGGIGLKTGTVSIANNDADENPYTFNVEGELVSVFTPEIDIRGTNGASIASGSSASVASGTDFGTATLSHTFTITNAGLASLTLTGTPSVVISGAGASQFTVTTFPSNSVPSHGSTTFTVHFSAEGAAGVKTAVVSIGNNVTSGGKDPYTFDLTGTVSPWVKVWRVDCSYAGRSDVPPGNIITGDYVEPAAAAANAAFGSSGVHDYWNTWDMDARLGEGGRLGGWAWFNGILTADDDYDHSTLWSTDGGASVTIGSTAGNGQHQPWYNNGTTTPFDILTGNSTSSGIGTQPPCTYSFVISGLTPGKTFLFYDYALRVGEREDIPLGYDLSLDGGAATNVLHALYSEGDAASGVLISTVVQVSGCVTVTLSSATMTGPGFQFTQVSPAPPRGVLLLIR